MCDRYFHATLRTRFCTAGVAFVVLGLWLSLTAGLRAADSLQDEVERDWLRQEAAKQQRSGSGITTQSDAAGAVDGVKDGRWGFHTSQDPNPWWQVDLGQSGALDRVLVYNVSHIPSRAARLKVLLSDDAKTWREVYAHDGTSFVGATDKKPLNVPLKGEKARFVRIQVPGPQWLHLDEVEVYGQPDPAKNIALNRPADQSSVSEWSTAKIQPKLDIAYPVEPVVARGRALAEQRRSQGLDVEAMTRILNEVEAKVKTLPASADNQARSELYLQARRVVRQLVLADPRLSLGQLLFVKRFTYHSSHI